MNVLFPMPSRRSWILNERKKPMPKPRSLRSGKVSQTFKLYMKFTRACCLLLFTLCMSMSLHAQINTPDYRLLRYIAKTRTETWDRFFILVSDLNNPLCLGVLALLFIGRWLLKNEHALQVALLGTFSVIVSQLVTFTGKELFGRLRPQLYDDTFIAVISAVNKSFPSGHTSEAFTVALALCYSYRQWWVRVPAMGWACLIAYARMYLGVHYPSDVIGGILVAAGSVYAVVLMMRNWNKNREGLG
ncbi:MAG: phosphatase PAP2 family protein [Chitinophagaceae bacterium]|nr:MAG: phosphatase PAP2 family protein [Chitinophagaceae bacterium]